MKLRDLTKEQIITALNNSKSVTDALGKLDAVKNGGNRNWLRKFIIENNIDISHFIKIQSKEEYEENPKYCKKCGKIIDWAHRENEFCSRSCATAFNNANKSTIKEDNRYCKNCGKLLTWRQNIYCSSNCKSQYEQNEYINRWKNGLETGLSGQYLLNKRIRKYLFDTRGCKCELCGWHEVNQYTNTIPLEIHHKDGNYQNNAEENLQILCPNCHSLTETYKSHNKQGRTMREKYYSKKE